MPRTCPPTGPAPSGCAPSQTSDTREGRPPLGGAPQPSAPRVRTVIATQQEWEDLAYLDPLWAILSEKKKKFGNWDLQDFFASGQAEIDAAMELCGFREGNNGRALDFGCGAGRLSRALRRYFGQVYGLDISKNMVGLARKYVPECTFLVNQTNSLGLFEDEFFDLVYSNIVLQHQRTQEVAKAYISEFIRVAKPGGKIMFQIPYRLSFRYKLQVRRRIYSPLRRLGFSADFLYYKLHLNPMRAIAVPPKDVERAVRAAGASVVRSFPDNFNQHSMSYLIAKPEAAAPRLVRPASRTT